MIHNQEEHLNNLKKDKHYIPRAVLDPSGNLTLKRNPIGVHPNMVSYLQCMLEAPKFSIGRATTGYSLHNRNKPTNKRGKLIRPLVLIKDIINKIEYTYTIKEKNTGKELGTGIRTKEVLKNSPICISFGSIANRKYKQKKILKLPL